MRRGSLQGAQAWPPLIYDLTPSCKSVLKPPPLHRTRRFRVSDLPGVPQPRGRWDLGIHWVRWTPKVLPRHHLTCTTQRGSPPCWLQEAGKGVIRSYPAGTCKCYLIRKKGLCRHGEADDPDTEILPWIIWVGSKSNQKCAYKAEAEGEGSVQRTPGLERWSEPRNAISNQAPWESAQILPSASRGLPDNTLMRDQWDSCWTSGLQAERGYISVVLTQPVCGNMPWHPQETNTLLLITSWSRCCVSPQLYWEPNTRSYTPILAKGFQLFFWSFLVPPPVWSSAHTHKLVCSHKQL